MPLVNLVRQGYSCQLEMPSLTFLIFLLQGKKKISQDNREVCPKWTNKGSDNMPIFSF